MAEQKYHEVAERVKKILTNHGIKEELVDVYVSKNKKIVVEIALPANLIGLDTVFKFKDRQVKVRIDEDAFDELAYVAKISVNADLFSELTDAEIADLIHYAIMASLEAAVLHYIWGL